VRRVLAERERRAIDRALDAVETALRQVKGALSDVDPRVKAAARFRLQRLEQLAQLCRVGQNLLKILLDSARVDIAPLKLLSETLSLRRS
jgi:hypothetical protein